MKRIVTWGASIIWNKAALLIAFAHFIISFWTDKLIFKDETGEFSGVLQVMKSMKAIITVKGAFFVFVILLWQGIFYFFLKTDKGFRYRTLFYFGVMFILLLLTWPGIWRIDEFGILESSVQLIPHYWQHYITSVWYVLSLMLFPFPSGVILVQIAIAALVYARFVSNCLKEYDLRMEREDVLVGVDEANRMQKRRFLFGIIISIPFFFFPVLDSNLYPIRMSLYAFLELLLLSELYMIYKKKRFAETYSKSDCAWDSSRSIAALAGLAAIVAVWRSEAVYYLVWFPGILIFIGGFRRYWKQIVLFIIMFAILFVPQKLGDKKTSGDQYELTSIVLPLVPLVLEAQQNDEEALLEEINLVVDTDVLSRAAAEGKNGINMLWGEPDFQRNHTTEEFACFKKAYYKLILKYPKAFLKERWQIFLASTVLMGDTTKMFSDEEVDLYENFRHFRTYPLSGSISPKVRISVINILEVRKVTDNTAKYWVTDRIYSPLPAVSILIIVIIVLFAQKKWTLTAILSALILRVLLIFLTAPAKLFMYYYSVYLIGFVVLFYVIAEYFFLYKRGDK